MQIQNKQYQYFVKSGQLPLGGGIEVRIATSPDPDGGYISVIASASEVGVKVIMVTNFAMGGKTMSASEAEAIRDWRRVAIETVAVMKELIKTREDLQRDLVVENKGGEINYYLIVESSK